MTTTNQKPILSLQSIEFDQEVSTGFYNDKLVTIKMTVVTKVDYEVTLNREMPTLEYFLLMKDITVSMEELFDDQVVYEVLENATDLERAREHLQTSKFKASGGTRDLQLRYLIRVGMDAKTSKAIQDRLENKQQLPWFFPRKAGTDPSSFVKKMLKVDGSNVAVGLRQLTSKSQKAELTNGNVTGATKLNFKTTVIGSPPDNLYRPFGEAVEAMTKEPIQLQFKPLIHFDSKLKGDNQYVRNTRVDFVYRPAAPGMSSGLKAEIKQLKGAIKLKMASSLAQNPNSDLWSTITWYESNAEAMQSNDANTQPRRLVAFVIQTKNATASDAAFFKGSMDWANAVPSRYSWGFPDKNSPEEYFKSLFPQNTIKVVNAVNEVKAEYRFEPKRGTTTAGGGAQLDKSMLLLTKTM